MKKKKIKILFQITPDIIGGAETYLFNLIRHLDKNYFEVIIFSKKNGIAVKMLKKLNIKTIIINADFSKKMGKLITILKNSDIDICQTNSFSPNLAVASCLADIPHLWRLGGDIRIAVRDLNAKQRQLYLKIIYGISKRVIFPSQFLRRQFSAKISKNISIINNGIDFDALKSIKPNNTLFNKKNVNIGMIAHLIPQKRHIDFIRAADIVRKNIPNAKFFIIGSPYPYKKSRIYTGNIHKIVRKSRLEKHIVFTGFIENIIETIAALDIVVLPSADEGSSNVIMEAMALAKPLVISNSGANPEFIRNGVNGRLITLGKYKKIAEAIIEIAKDKEKALKFGRAAKITAKKIFDINKSAFKYSRLYNKIQKSNFKSLASYHTSS